MSQRSEYMAIVAAMSRMDAPPPIIAELAFDIWREAARFAFNLDDGVSDAAEIIRMFKEWGEE